MQPIQLMKMGESLSHLKRPPFAMEWLSSSTSNGATACTSSSSGTQQPTERKRPSGDPIMSSVAFKSPRVSDTETMETAADTITTGPVSVATSSGDESLPSRHHPMEAALGIEIHVTQSEEAMETEDLPTIDKEVSQVGTMEEKGGDSEQHEEHRESLSKPTTEGFGLLPPSCDPRNRSPSKDPVLFPVSMPLETTVTTTDDKSEPSSAAETTEQTISTIVQAVEKELSSRRSSQSEDNNTECTTSEDTMEQKSREIASVSGDRPKTPPPLAMDNMFSLGSNTDSDDDNNDNRSTQSPVDPNLYELVGQMRQSPSRSASMILLASMNAQKIFNAPGTSTDEPSNGSPEKEFVPHSEEEKLQFEEALPATQGSLADISDIVGDLSKPSTSSSPARLEVEKQRIDRIMSLTRMDLFEPESTSSEAVHEGSDSGVDAGGAVDLSQSQSTTNPLVAPSSVTDLLQKDIQTNNGSSSEDLASLEKQMREKIAARLEQKDLLPSPSKDE